jgi:hypothetical protein
MERTKRIAKIVGKIILFPIQCFVVLTLILFMVRIAIWITKFAWGR